MKTSIAAMSLVLIADISASGQGVIGNVGTSARVAINDTNTALVARSPSGELALLQEQQALVQRQLAAQARVLNSVAARVAPRALSSPNQQGALIANTQQPISSQFAGGAAGQISPSSSNFAVDGLNSSTVMLSPAGEQALLQQNLELLVQPAVPGTVSPTAGPAANPAGPLGTLDQLNPFGTTAPFGQMGQLDQLQAQPNGVLPGLGPMGPVNSSGSVQQTPGQPQGSTLRTAPTGSAVRRR